MNELTIFTWDGKERAVRFIGYNRDHTACFIRDQTNAIRTIALRLPNLYDLRYYSNPIGSDGSPVVSIRRALLHPPACFQSKSHKEAYEDPDSAQGRLARTFLYDLWKVFTPHKCWLEPEDDAKLEELLKLELERQRLAYKVALNEVDEEVKLLAPEDTVGAEKLRKELEDRFTVVMSDGADGSKTFSTREVPLDFVRRGWAGLRERFLEREWAKLFGLDLRAIAADAPAFRTWLEKSAYNARRTTTYLNTRSVEDGVCLELDPWQWEVLEATVLYEVRFANGTRCWLSNIEERAVTDAQEVEDVGNLEGRASQVPVNSTVVESLAQAQRMLSGGLLISMGPLVEKMSPDERLFFNWLISKHPTRRGKVLSYREIGARLNVSATAVQRRRDALEQVYGNEISRFIAHARAVNEKGMHPDQCDSGHKKRTDNYDENTERD